VASVLSIAAIGILAATQGPDEPLAAALDAHLAAHAAFGWSGSVVVSRGGEALLVRGYGLADPASGRANDAHTLFEVASITKQFTAAAVLKLWQEERLDLDDPIAKHLPRVPREARGITIRHLLNHTSGMPRSNAEGRGHDLERAVAAYLTGGPRHEPGTRFEYWNGGYALLAAIVEEVSGQPIQVFCTRALFAPAGMEESAFTGYPGIVDASHAAVGQTGEGAPRGAFEHPYGDFDWQYRGMGGTVTSVFDLLKWDRALAGTTVLGERTKQELFRPVKDGYACGWWIGKAADGSPRQSHGGSVRGFLSELRRYPSIQGCIALLCNGDSVESWRMADDLECLLLARPLPNPVPPTPIPLAPHDLAALEGSYRARSGRLLVEREGGAGEDVLWGGIEGQGLLEEILDMPRPEPGLAPDKLAREAAAIVRAIARGDVEPLRARMAARIPRTWPDEMKRTIWPRVEASHGKLEDLEVLGTRVRPGQVEIVLALRHEREESRARVVLSAAGLEILDWQGPRLPLRLRLVPVGEGELAARVEGEYRRFRCERREAEVRAVRLGRTRLVRE